MISIAPTAKNPNWPSAANDYWQQQLDTGIDSGLSGAAFCKQKKIGLSTIPYWRSKLSKSDKAPSRPRALPGLLRVTSLQTLAMRELTLTLLVASPSPDYRTGNVDVLRCHFEAVCNAAPVFAPSTGALRDLFWYRGRRLIFSQAG